MYYRENYSGFAKAKSTLLIFRKKSAKSQLQLRHQRTCDVVFDFYRKDEDFNMKPTFFVYKLIEILLPKAGYEPGQQKKKLKMLEIWADNVPRKGWFKITEKEVKKQIYEEPKDVELVMKNVENN